MKCLRCGYCCKTSFVVIVIDPLLGLTEGNIKAIDANKEPCPHLQGGSPGKYSCAIHNESWYKDTPCYSHGQIEYTPDEPCRIGDHIIDKGKKEKSKKCLPGPNS